MHRFSVLPLLVLLVIGPASAARAQKRASDAAAADRSETRLVTVDAIVTDKNGEYVRDLSPTEVHVLEGNKEQPVKSVSREATAGSAPTHTILFFSKIPVSDQPYAREAATRFIEAYTGPHRLVAILNYLGSGGTKLIQGFTDDAARLMQATSNMEASGVLSSDSGTGISGVMSSVYSDPGRASPSYDVRSQLHALVDVAKTLGSMPGRKAIVMLAPTINYDVRVRTDPGSAGAGTINSAMEAPPPIDASYYIQPEDLRAAIDACNRAAVSIYLVDVRVDRTPTENQLGPLALATGGLSIDNSKDALNALRKIAQEQGERYVIAYSPVQPSDEKCHRIKVKVDRAGATVRTRAEYCDINPADPLEGTPTGRDLEALATGAGAGSIAAQMQSAFFYTAPDRARVHIAAEIPTAAFDFVKQNGRFQASLNVLGIAATREGAVAGRFSDTVELALQSKKDVEQFKQRSYHYENDLITGSGDYALKVVFSPARGNFARLETPLAIDRWDGEHFALSGIALSKESRTVTGAPQPGAALSGEHGPFVSRGLQFIPSGSSRFRKADPAMLYVEIYEPLLRNPDPPKVLLQLVVLDRSSGDIKIDSGRLDMTNRVLPGNPVVPVGLKVPLESLSPGAYAIVLKASDSAGNVSAVRHAEFQVE